VGLPPRSDCLDRFQARTMAAHRSAMDDMSDMDMSGGHAMLDCDGKPIPERQGNWQGHILPGSIFIIWGCHWMIGTYWRYLVASRAGRAFRCKTTEGLLPFLPQLTMFNKKYPLESILKALGGFLLFVLQVHVCVWSGYC
jgi:hypothetical protein